MWGSCFSPWLSVGVVISDDEDSVYKDNCIARSGEEHIVRTCSYR